MRTFDRSRIDISNPRLQAFRIVCAACGVTATVNCNKYTQLPPEVVIRKFTEKGWLVGNNENNDLCPEHKHRVRMIEKDLEPKIVEKIASAVRVLQSALEKYAELENPKQSAEVMRMMTEFHRRVFGDAREDEEAA
ncbi:hypothetical protein GA0061099_10305 [Bradyrhizobium yuanmingense]|uniref:Uncharacterized protein n=1 Tax=Bradyrhizobium yuanmingense TaxID=108015 RepID=A0A1C3XJC1_9BRAD|nr:hypothetical protein [Bradyrhizobium yuanmingense]TWI17756.1 hypothetical protein IQ15_07346 [Bradyrhizobium yuanmingense]SCB52245.1 hypothetical protein GA0061099_10305 [Bradyrhizobium yuanmingense]